MKRALLVVLACAGCYDFGSIATKPSSCSSLNGFVCDGFEDKLPAPPQWLDLHGAIAGATDVTSQRAYRGAYAFHVHAAATNGTTTNGVDVGGRVNTTSQAWGTTAASAMQQHAYLRAFYYVPALTGGRLFLLEVGRLPTATLPFSGFAVFVDVGGTVGVSQQATISQPGPMMPTGRWVCVELGPT
jgi:hypothetical protein